MLHLVSNTHHFSRLSFRIVKKSSDVFGYISVLALLAQLCCLLYNSACTVLFILFNFGSIRPEEGSIDA
jgi:hypothetical protein